MADIRNSIITATCDEKYSPYAIVFINSLNRYNNINIIIRTVNCRKDTINNIKSQGKNITVIEDNPIVSTKRRFAHGGELVYDGLLDSMIKNKTSIRSPRLLCSEQMAYCSNIKFDTINQLLSNYTSVIYMDVDSIIRGDISELLTLTSTGDISMYKDVPYTEQCPGSRRLQGNDVLYHGGLIGVNNTNRSRSLINEWSSIISKNMFDWDIDESLFYSAHADDSVDITCLPKTYKDEDLLDDSLIWSGAGHTKFSQDRYIDECKKYNPKFT